MRQTRHSSSWTFIGYVSIAVRQYYVSNDRMVLGCERVRLPKHLRVHPNLKHFGASFDSNANDCLFQCVFYAQHRAALERLPRNAGVQRRRLLSEGVAAMRDRFDSEMLAEGLVPPESGGVELAHLSLVERVFEVNLVLYRLTVRVSRHRERLVLRQRHRSLRRGGVSGSNLVRRAQFLRASDTLLESRLTVFINLYRNHCSLITNVRRYCEFFSCSDCSQLFRSARTLANHRRRFFDSDGGTCANAAPLVTTNLSDFYSIRPALADELRAWKCGSPDASETYDDINFAPYFAVFDCETFMRDALSAPALDAKLVEIGRLELCSLATAGHLPSSQLAVGGVHVNELDSESVVRYLLDYLKRASTAVRDCLTSKHEPTLRRLLELDAWCVRVGRFNPYAKLRARLLRSFEQLTCLSYCGARFDHLSEIVLDWCCRSCSSIFFSRLRMSHRLALQRACRDADCH